jgi:hypothetical protein
MVEMLIYETRAPKEITPAIRKAEKLLADAYIEN